ncbi:enoyl-CoA hydratase/isomerase family protein [Streptomyces sp. M10(2022)]
MGTHRGTGAHGRRGPSPAVRTPANPTGGTSPPRGATGPFPDGPRCAARGSVPLVAAVEGYALGGGLELALACDLVVAGEGSLFGLPELEVGAVPGGGAVHSLLRRAGRGWRPGYC